MKKLLLIGCVLLVATVTIVLLYMAHIRSPKYSLWQAKKAFEEHDVASFEKHVDVEGIVDNLIDDVLELGMEKGKPTEDWEGSGHSIDEGLVTVIKPQLTKIARKEISSLIETGEFEKKKAESEKSEFPLRQLWRDMKAEKSTFEGIAYEKREGKIAYIGLIFRTEKRDTPFVVNLKMRDLDSHWQVAGVTNAKEIFDIFADADILKELGLLQKQEKIDPGNRHISLLEELITGQYVDNKTAGRLFVIKGKLRSDYPEPRNFIRVKGVLYLPDGNVARDQTVYCGNVLSDADLQILDKQSIRKKLCNRFGDNKSNFRVPPGRVLPFMVVFSDIPHGLGEFSVEVVDSRAG